MGFMDEAALGASSFSSLFLKWVRQPRRAGGKEDDDRDPRNKNISTSNLEFTSPRDFVFVFFDVTSALRTVFFSPSGCATFNGGDGLLPVPLAPAGRMRLS